MELKLYMLLLGCRPAGRFTEQHDIFFGIGKTLKDLIPDIKKWWPEAKGNIHIDAWRQINNVDGFAIAVEEIHFMQTKKDHPKKENDLFFINLGGYKENEFDEFHYKMLVVASNMDKAKDKARQSAFFKHVSLPSTENHPTATSHIDDKYGIDVDDMYAVEDILPVHLKEKFSICISAVKTSKEDELHLGYFKLDAIMDAN